MSAKKEERKNMKDQLAKYCDPSGGSEITSHPWTATVKGEQITYATNGHMVVIVPGFLPPYAEKQRPKTESFFTRKKYDMKISAEELEGVLSGPCWPPLRQDCKRCGGSGKILCQDCSGSGRTTCQACGSDIKCGCDGGHDDCPKCTHVRTPVNYVWVNSALVNGVYLSRVLEIFKGTEVLFLLAGPSDPIFLSDGTNRAAIMPVRSGTFEDGSPRIKLKHIGPEKEEV